MSTAQTMDFAEWSSFIGTGTDPNSWLGRRLADSKKLWNDARTKFDQTREEFRTRFDHYQQHIHAANRVRAERVQRAQNYSRNRSEIKDRIKNARTEVLEEIRHDRELLSARYQAEIEGLSLFNPLNWIKRGKLKFQHINRVLKHNIDVVRDPVIARTHRRKNLYREALGYLSKEHIKGDEILHDTQKNFQQEAVRGIFKGKNPSNTNQGPKPSPL